MTCGSTAWLGKLFSAHQEADRHLKVNLAKCEFTQATGTFPGQGVGQGQVRQVHGGVTVVKQYPAPTSKKELVYVLSLVSYYHICCRISSTVVAPLTDLSKAGPKYIRFMPTSFLKHWSFLVFNFVFSWKLLTLISFPCDGIEHFWSSHDSSFLGVYTAS